MNGNSLRTALAGQPPATAKATTATFVQFHTRLHRSGTGQLALTRAIENR